MHDYDLLFISILPKGTLSIWYSEWFIVVYGE